MVVFKGLSEEVKDEQDCLSLEELQVGKWVGLKALSWVLGMRVWSTLKKKKLEAVVCIGQIGKEFDHGLWPLQEFEIDSSQNFQSALK